MHAAAALAAALLADVVTPTSAPSSSPVAEIITATFAGVATLLAAVVGVIRLRRNRDEAAVVAPAGDVDPEDRPARLRERIAALEADVRNLKAQLADVAEQLQLRRAADVIAEASAAPRRRRSSRED